MKRCTMCGEQKPLDEFAPKRRAEPEKRHSRCRACGVVLRREWGERNPDKLAEYRDRGREKANAASRRWRAANPDKVKASKWRDYAKNADAYKAAAAEWRRQNLERNRETIRKWIAEHPLEVSDMRRRSRFKRRAKLLDAFVEDVHPLIVLEASDGVCGICGDDVDPVAFEMDHVIPLARGGRHAYDNIQPAHPACNRQKGALL